MEPWCFPSTLQAYRWCIEAMKEISPGLPVKVVVDVLRQASKVCAALLYLNVLYYWGDCSVVKTCLMFPLQACVVKREFRKAEQLIKHAVFLAR